MAKTSPSLGTLIEVARDGSAATSDRHHAFEEIVRRGGNATRTLRRTAESLRRSFRVQCDGVVAIAGGPPQGVITTSMDDVVTDAGIIFDAQGSA